MNGQTKLQSAQNEPVVETRKEALRRLYKENGLNICVLRAAATMKVGKDVRNAMSFGEASNENLMGGGKKFPVAMAEKRAMSRVVLKIAGFYEQGVFGQDEIVD